MKYKAGPDAPGYFKRLREYYRYQEKLSEVDDPLERQELLMDWLAAYLTWPPSRFLKRVAKRLASKVEVDDLLAAVIGGAGIEPKKDETSDGG